MRLGRSINGWSKSSGDVELCRETARILTTLATKSCSDGVRQSFEALSAELMEYARVTEDELKIPAAQLESEDFGQRHPLVEVSG